MEKVAVLTYSVRHRKTYDVLTLLKAKGYKDVSVYATPLSYTKKKFPLIKHRPDLILNIPDIEELCRNLSFDYVCGDLTDFEIEEDRIVLVAGAGILPDDFVKTHKIINSHPGYIPLCRGLDALKWAIVEDKPIGTSTHLLGEYVDAGEVIERRIIDIYPYDTFHAVAQRVYENEITMLVDAIELIKKNGTETILPGDSIVHKRMPEEIELNLFDTFEEYKKKHSVTYP